MRLGTRKWSLAGLMVLMGTLALLVSACGGSTSTTGNSDQAPASQQVLHNVMSGEADIATMDPNMVQDANSIVPIDLVWPGLLTLDKNLAVQPWAASAMPSVSPDGTTYTFKLHPGMKFSDGEPIDAAAFAFSINRSLNPCTASPVAYYLYTIKDAVTFNGESCTGNTISAAKGQTTPVIKTLIGDSIVVVDSQTLTITLAQPAAYFLEALTYPTSYAIPQNLVNKYGAKWTDHLADNGGMGGNMYKLVSWPHDGTIKLVANPNFWGTKPIIQEQDFTIYKSVETQYNAFLAGQNDFGVPPSAQYAQAKAKPDFHEVGQLWIGYYGLNWKMAPFTDLGVRQGFELALNKTAIANNVLHGTVIPTNHIVPQGMPGYNPALVGVDGTQSTDGNVAKAQALVKPYVDANCGGQYKNCPKVVLTYPSSGADETNTDTAALNMWQTAFPGWPISIQATDFNTLLNGMAARSLQAYSIGWIADYPDPQDWLSLQFGPNAQYNDTNVVDTQANTLMNKADGESDQTQRLKDYEAAEQLLVTDVAWLPLFQVKAYYEVRPYVKNYVLDSQGLTPLSVWQTVYIAKH